MRRRKRSTKEYKGRTDSNIPTGPRSRKRMKRKRKRKRRRRKRCRRRMRRLGRAGKEVKIQPRSFACK